MLGGRLESDITHQGTRQFKRGKTEEETYKDSQVLSFEAMITKIVYVF